MSDYPESQAGIPATEEGGPESLPEERAPAEQLAEDVASQNPTRQVSGDPVAGDPAHQDLLPEARAPEDLPQDLPPGGVAPDQGVAGELKQTSLREPDEDALRLAEAVVFASAEPVTPRGLARVLADDIDADAVLAALRARYQGRGVELVDAANGVMFRTAVDLAPRLRKVIESPRRLPRVAMETLAIVAYHQPVTRAEIEHIRGTALSQQTLDALLELNLIAPKGRRETPGRPTLWGTTPEFLAHFGLKDLRELPRREDLLLETGPPKATPEVLPPDLQPPPE
jgi:segregation and condensation protein B